MNAILKRRRNLFITEDQNEFLELQNQLTVSEHIRRAIDQYINKLKMNNSSESLSKSNLPKCNVCGFIGKKGDGGKPHEPCYSKRIEKNCYSCFAPFDMPHAASCNKRKEIE